MSRSEPIETSRLDELKASTTLATTADLLRFTPTALAYILYKKPADQKYTKFEVPKKTGGTRTICAPTPQLKLLQKNLATLLQDCAAEIESSLKVRRVLAHGFRRGSSIGTNAGIHCNRRFVLNLDLIDFFAQFNFGRVYSFFLKNKKFKLEKKTATLLAQIACFEDKLPQGSPCSPVITNLIAHSLDIRLLELACNYRCSYSRYADDLTFSTNMAEFPADLALPTSASAGKWSVGEQLMKTIERHGFSVNPEKTRMQLSTSRQDVTGVVVNTKLNTRDEYRRENRVLVHSLLTHGAIFTKGGPIKDDDESSREKKEIPLDVLQGRLAFIYEIDRQSRERHPGAAHSDRRLELFKRFLFFKDFYGCKRTTIIFEGQTDAIYIKAAMRSMAKQFPEFVSGEGTKSQQIKPRLYRFSELGKMFFGTNSGSGDIKKFILKYKEMSAHVRWRGKQQAVVLMIDSDHGSNAIFEMLKSKFKIPRDDSLPCYRLFDNLYLVSTPLIQGKPTMIEDFFPAAVKALQLGGKSFNPAKKINPATEYSKEFFATHVVLKNQATIDFSGFGPLLKRISAAVALADTIGCV